MNAMNKNIYYLYLEQIQHNYIINNIVKSFG